MSKSDDPGSREQFSLKKNLQTALWLLQGKRLDTLSQELKIKDSTLSAWQDSAFNSNLTALKSKLSFVRTPEGSGVTGRFIQILKEQLPWIKTCEPVEDLRLVL